MVRNTLITLRWLISLGVKFMRVVPAATLTVVLATLVSQVAVLLAFFLPLKVVILLGSEGMPRYFPQAFAAIDRDVLVVALCVATVVFYGLHLLAERVIAAGTEYGTRRLLARSHKMVLFENQDEAAASGYQRYSRALASGVFVVLALVVLGLVYPAMALIMLAFALLVVAAFWVGDYLSADFRAVLPERLGPYLGIAGAVGFLSAFAYLVADFIFWSPPGLLVAIIALLLSRQVFTRATGLVNDVTGLNRQRQRLDALFFHGKVWLPGHEKADQGLWPLLAPQQREEWVRAVLDELVGDTGGPVTCRWWQTGVPGVVALRAVCSEEETAYLVKLFDVRRTAAALHEATLLAQAPKDLPAPKFVGATQVDQFHCHVFALPRHAAPGPKRYTEVVAGIRAALLAVELPAGMVQRYTRSRPLFWQHLDAVFLQRLRLAADGESLAHLERFGAHLNALRRQLQALPLAVLNPNINTDTVLAVDGAGGLLHWGQWSLEPAGAGWPVPRLSALEGALAEAAGRRPALAGVGVAQVEACALAYAMDKAFRRQQYTSALELLPELLERLEQGE